MMAIQRILSMCERAITDDTRVFSPTILYNEGWMIRLIVDWFAAHPGQRSCFSVPQNTKWYSEALLPSTFLPRYRGDRYSESWTHADCAIGHFTIGETGSGDLTLNSDAAVFCVLEAKMFSKLSPGVTHARYYNQAARTVACIAEVLRRANRLPSQFETIGFSLIAPQSRVDAEVFSRMMTYESIQATVERRVQEYDDSKTKVQWFQDWFLPLLAKIDIRTISYEEVLSEISKEDLSNGRELEAFYQYCLQFNRMESP